MIHHKKNYWLYKYATCHNLWLCDFTDVTAFSSLFFLALHHCFFLYIFFLLWLLLWLFNFYQVRFHGYSFSGAPFSPECCFFCPVLGGWFLALRRSPISSDWFFVWLSLRPSSTQVPAVVILVFLVFPRASLFLVCCLGRSPHVSQTVVG